MQKSKQEQIVTQARTWLGTPFHHQAAIKHLYEVIGTSSALKTASAIPKLPVRLVKWSEAALI